MKIRLPHSLRAAVLAAALVATASNAYAYQDLNLNGFREDGYWAVNETETYNKVNVYNEGDLYVFGTLIAKEGVTISSWAVLAFQSGTIVGDVTFNKNGDFDAWHDASNQVTIKGNCTFNSGSWVDYYEEDRFGGFDVSPVTVTKTLTLNAGTRICFTSSFQKGDFTANTLPQPEDGVCLFRCAHYAGDLTKVKLMLVGEEEKLGTDYYKEYNKTLNMDLVAELAADGMYEIRLVGKPTVVTYPVKGSMTQTVEYGEKDTVVFSGSGTIELLASSGQRGTTINGATVIAGGDRSFGSGSITLAKGRLDLAGMAVGNEINATGGTIAGGWSYGGALNVGGKVALEDSLSGTNVTVRGTLTGGWIEQSEILLDGGTLDSWLDSCTVTSTGKATIKGAMFDSEVEVGGGVLTATGALVTTFTCNITGGTVKFSKTISDGCEVGINLENGTLDFGKTAMGGMVQAMGGTITGATLFNGEISVEGDVKLGGVTTAKILWADSGSISGGSIKDTRVELNGASVTSPITGASSVLVGVSTTLAGKLDYTGDTEVMSGSTLTLNTALKNSEVFLSDGTLDSNGYLPKSVLLMACGKWYDAKGIKLTGGQSLTMNGGVVEADVTLGGKSSITLGSDSSITGDLALEGGTFSFYGSADLEISGSLRVSKATALDVSTLDGSSTISCSALSGDASKLLTLGAPTTGRRSYGMTVDGNTITVAVSGDNTDLTWKGAKGKWEVAGSQVWDAATEDNHFYHGDRVTFDTAATVTLTTKLAPGSVTVQGDGAVTFSGSGSIAGDTALTMSGSNTLKMNATNTYTGGTFITNGTVVATGVDSFGKGDIELSGGTLNLGKKAVKNFVLVNGDSSILNGKGFAGTIILDSGTLTLKDGLTGTLVLNGGTLLISGVKNVAKLTFGNVVDNGYTEIVDADRRQYAFIGNKLMLMDIDMALDEPAVSKDAEPQEAIECERTVAAVPVPQHVELPGAGLYTTMMRAQLDGNRAAFDSIRQLMGTGEPGSADGRYRFAAQATSASTDMKDYRRQGFGGLVMVEEVFSSKAVGGLSLNYEHADINPDGAGKYESDDTRVNAHLLVSTKNWQSRSIAGIGIHDYDVNHTSATGHSFNLMEEVSRTIAVDDKSVIAPFVRVETGYNVIGSINDGVLAIDKQTAWSTDVTLGARFVKTCDFGTVMLEAGVTKAIGDQGGAIGASLVDDPATRSALSPSSRNRWSATLGGSVQVPVGTRSSLHAGATLRLHGTTTEVNANVGYSIKF